MADCSSLRVSFLLLSVLAWLSTAAEVHGGHRRLHTHANHRHRRHSDHRQVAPIPLDEAAARQHSGAASKAEALLQLGIEQPAQAAGLTRGAIRHRHRGAVRERTIVHRKRAHQLHQVHTVRNSDTAGPAPAPASKPDADSVLSDLLKNYEPQKAPKQDDGRVEVAVAFRANKLLSLNHIEQTATFVGWVRQYWYDPRLAWTRANSTSEFNYMPVGTDDIWIPDTMVMNSVDFNVEENCGQTDAYLFEDTSMKVETVKKADLNLGLTQGFNDMKYNVLWSQPCVLTTKCDVDLTWYPFDSNVCPLEFAPWSDGFLNMHMALNQSETHISLPEFDVFQGNLSVSRITWTSMAGAQFDEATINMVINRHGHYYVINFICPMILMLWLSWMSMILPVKASDRVTYMVTIVLTVMAVNFITAERLPATNSDMWLDKFHACTLLAVVLVTIYTVVIYRYSPEEDWPEDHKRGRRCLLEYCDRIARIVYGLALFIMLTWLFMEVKLNTPAGDVRNWSGTATLLILITIALVSCCLCSGFAIGWLCHVSIHKEVRKLEVLRLSQDIKFAKAEEDNEEAYFAAQAAAEDQASQPVNYANQPFQPAQPRPANHNPNVPYGQRR
eukprot:gnl/TRDRNA2_/TRDRNA2_195239_c0_seq1.p1 gnl/TRDRNA2_/TRDRNA2_195239_c0~~gnl/TRDRNA2_/TRDRNA2_195239_c0_seq1.p1  ORF type:complete len:647 (-),score=80.72 gnl/TRDRNA2_/TRDRNA2_195239_c0_seq1:120-1961(-)